MNRNPCRADIEALKVKAFQAAEDGDKYESTQMLMQLMEMICRYEGWQDVADMWEFIPKRWEE